MKIFTLLFNWKASTLLLHISYKRCITIVLSLSLTQRYYIGPGIEDYFKIYLPTLCKVLEIVLHRGPWKSFCRKSIFHSWLHIRTMIKICTSPPVFLNSEWFMETGRYYLFDKFRCAYLIYSESSFSFCTYMQNKQ